MSKNITAVSKVLSQDALLVLENQLKRNVWAVATRANPNADKLKDGAIQRMSVTPSTTEPYVKMNPELIGMYKRPELNEKAGATSYIHSNIWDGQPYRHRVARVYQPQKKHVHNVPQNKSIGKWWAIEFESWGTYKSPLMGWTSGTQDQMTKISAKVPTLSAAVKYCEMMGWGYDVQFPRHRWHTKKNYSDNFAWKGHAQAEEEYD